jgi:hypothetical protein
MVAAPSTGSLNVTARLPKSRLHSATGLSGSELKNWRELCGADTYITGLQRNFSKYRDSRFAGLEDLFEIHKGGAVVFKPEHVENNLLIPPCSANERERIIGKIPPSKRHKHFKSMQSSQALAQSVFGTIEVLRRLPLLSAVKSEHGLPAFGPMVSQAKLYFEKEMQTLGKRPQAATSVDVWFEFQFLVVIGRHRYGNVPLFCFYSSLRCPLAFNRKSVEIENTVRICFRA